MWYVYILRSQQDNNLYIGSTNDLHRRLNEHHTGHVTATRPRLPFTLESYIAVRSEEKARELEIYFKSGSGHAILKKRIL